MQPTAITIPAQAPQNGREARNLAEKHRRDKLNASIAELSTMVPHVADSQRRMDKTAVLRFAAHGLRLQYVFGKSKRTCKKVQEREPDAQQLLLGDTLLQLLDSFFITLTSHGQIVLVSSGIERLLGHCQSDLYGQSILQIVHPEDQALILEQLIPRNMETLFQMHDNIEDHDTVNDDDDSSHHNDYEDNEDYLYSENMHSDCDRNKSCSNTANERQKRRSRLEEIDKILREDRRCFTVRLSRASGNTRSDACRKYEIVMINGCFRRSDFSDSIKNFPIVSQLIRRSRSSNPVNHGVTNTTAMALHGISGNDCVFIAVARVIRPPKIVNRLLEANKLQYRTRHLIDGRIVDCDQRIGLVAGYMKDEVRNLCPFTFMHQDDVRWVVVALRQMYDCKNEFGESCYRLLSRNGHFIYLQTKGYLEIDKNTNRVHSMICINTLLDEEEGERKVQEMKRKFSVIIKSKVPSNSENLPASGATVEYIVRYLLENLPSSTQSVGLPALSSDYHNNKDMCNTPTATTSLSIVAPDTDSVKNSISKSVNVVSVTVAKSLKYANSNNRSPSCNYTNSEASMSPTSSLETDDDNTERSFYKTTTTTIKQNNAQQPEYLKNDLAKQNLQRPSVLVQVVSRECNKTATESLSDDSERPNEAEEGTRQHVNGSVLRQQLKTLKRLQPSYGTSSDITDCSDASDCSISPAKRAVDASSCTSPVTANEVHNILASSLRNLDQNLQTMGHDTQLLREQHDCLNKVANVEASYINNEELDSILMEYQQQTELLHNIKTQYTERQRQQQQ